MGILKVEIKEIKEGKKQKTKQVRILRGRQIFSIKGKMVNILGFKGQKAKSSTINAVFLTLYHVRAQSQQAGSGLHSVHGLWDANPYPDSVTGSLRP